MSRAALDLFGYLLVNKVRDEAISDWRMIIHGSMKGDIASIGRLLLDSFSLEQREIILSLVPSIVDTVLHHMLFLLEQQQEMGLNVTIGSDAPCNIKDISDGLSGELPSDEGWVARFSKEKFS